MTIAGLGVLMVLTLGSAQSRPAPTAAAAKIPADSPEVLRRVWGVSVQVASPDLAADPAGPTEADVQADVEMRLRQSGIRVFTREQRARTPGLPFLRITVGACQTAQGTWAVCATAQVCEDVQMVRRSGMRVTGAVTWQTAPHAVDGGLSKGLAVRAPVADLVDRFAAALKAANPPPATPRRQPPPRG